MRTTMFRSGRYANVTATLALVVALGGTSYAAIRLPANSVGTSQLERHAVSNSKLRANAVTSNKVKNGSLLAADFKAGQLPAGPAGPAGATNVVSRRVPSIPVAAGAIGALKLTCNPGERAINGGLQSDGDLANIFVLTESFPVTTGDVPTGWYVEVRNTASASNRFVGFLLCVKP